MTVCPTEPAPSAGFAQDGDAGFSLVEVVVAIALISMVMGSLSMAFIRSMKVVDANQDRQAAVIVANQQMEFVRSLLSTSGSGNKNVLGGRTQSDVQALDAETRSFTFTDDVEASDDVPSASDGAADDLVPRSKTVEVARSSFLVRTYLRSCWRSDSDGTCGTAGPRPDTHRLLRVYVTVSWVPTEGESCVGWSDPTGTRHCEYVVAAMIEPNISGDRLYR